ncbi:MAG: RNA polymerase sporulation sigma factor SigH [Clostridiaceae bacterium]|nr:RNA polymerase sporulation sigma factor SigH [Clostridiaceae bacterium]
MSLSLKSTKADLSSLPDEELVLLSQKGDTYAQECLIYRYRAFVRNKAQAYFLIGADKEDLVQEGMIGLFKAVRDYKADKLSSFKSFAELCVTRQIITAIKTATRQKHTPLNTYVSLNKPLFDEEYDVTLLDVFGKGEASNPEEIIISREEIDDIGVKVTELLSKFECKVLAYYLQGKSYQEIGEVLNKQPKSIDNALQRIKRKLEKFVS